MSHQPTAHPTPSVDVPAGPVDDLARALYGLSALRRDLQRCAGIEHAVAGLTMLGIVRRTGAVRISDLAHESQVNLSVASRQIQALEDEGLVDRVADPHDGRSSLIAISAAGEAKLDSAHARLTGVLATATGDWRADEVAGLADGLDRLRAALVDDHPAGTSSTASTSTLPADRSAADPTLTSADPAGARHEEHTR